MGAAASKWIAIVVDILAYELVHLDDDQMLSDTTHRWVDRHPIAARVAITSAGAVLTAHLAKLIDPRFDAISRSFFLRSRRARSLGASEY